MNLSGFRTHLVPITLLSTQSSKFDVSLYDLVSNSNIIVALHRKVQLVDIFKDHNFD